MSRLITLAGGCRIMPAPSAVSPQRVADLAVVSFPDPVLRKACQPVDWFGERLDALVQRMWQLMHAHKGVGLAAPQVGLPWRVFVWNPTGRPEDDAVCVNPRLDDLRDSQESEEGCLSIEGVTVNVRRALSAVVRAQRPDGGEFELRGEGLMARIWQHEIDHLDGRLILDYMSVAEELANRKAIRELESKYKSRTRRKRR